MSKTPDPILNNTKFCMNPNCTQINPQNLSNFSTDNGRKGKKDRLCKICRKEASRLYYQNNKERLQPLYRENYYKYRDKALKRSKIRRFERVYGITEIEVNELLKKQNYVCAICNKKETVKDRMGNVRALSVDHCHKTNKVRGILCRECNLGIGNFHDDIELLEKTIKYLKNNK